MLDIPWEEMAKTDQQFLADHVRVVVQWVVDILKRPNPRYAFPHELRKGGKMTSHSSTSLSKALLREAQTAAACCKSIASGHTNSTLESVRAASPELPLSRFVERKSVDKSLLTLSCPLSADGLCSQEIEMEVNGWCAHLLGMHPDYDLQTVCNFGASRCS